MSSMTPKPSASAPRVPPHLRVLATVGVVLALLVGGCASTSPAGAPTAPPTSSPYAVVAPASLPAGDPIPEPSGPVVLTVSGDVGSTAPIRFDMATLESLGLVEYSVMDKQAEGRRAMFRGVLLEDLLEAVGAQDGTTLHTVALNEYAVDIPVSDARDFPVLLATSIDGERMSVERYGPVRVVYPTDGVDLDPAVYDPRWIWQLTTIDVS